MTFIQIKKAIDELPLRQQMKILETLEERLFAQRIDQMAAFLRSRSKTKSYKKITSITEKTRKQLYAQAA